MSAKSVFAWCLYDWAMSAYNTVIGTFIFSAYFAATVAENSTSGTMQWAYTLTVSGLAVAILSPVLGAIADRTGRRKPWLAVFTFITVTSAAALWFVRPDSSWVVFALLVVGLGNITFELANVFYNALLTDVAPQNRLGRVSGWGWGLGYIGGLSALAVCLHFFVQPQLSLFGVSTDEQGHIRATSLVVAVWYAVFALPLFLLMPDRRSSGMGWREAIISGCRTLAQTVRNVRQYKQVVRFLIASAIYRDGLNTIFTFGGIYAAGTFGMEIAQIIQFGIALNVVAGLGAIAFSWVDDWIGAKRTILISLIFLMLFGVPLLLVGTPIMAGLPEIDLLMNFSSVQEWFMLIALGLGFFVGPAQAAGRSLMARLAPPNMVTEMFGLYALSGRAVAFFGPFLLALLTDAFDSQRGGMAITIAFFLIGFLLMLTVREKNPA